MASRYRLSKHERGEQMGDVKLFQNQTTTAPRKQGGSMTPEEYEKQKPAHDEQLYDHIRDLTKKEAAFAHERYGYYHSSHEGLAIIEEEVAEAAEKMWWVNRARKRLRRAVRCDETKEYTSVAAKDVYVYAMGIAFEAIHVAATAQRYLEALEEGHGEFAHIRKPRLGMEIKPFGPLDTDG